MPRGTGSLKPRLSPSKPKKSSPGKRPSPTQRRRRSDREIRTLEKLSNAITFKSHVEPATAYSTRTGRATTSPFSLDALQERQAQSRIAKDLQVKPKRVRTRPKPKKPNRLRPVALKKPTSGTGTPGRKRGSQQTRTTYKSQKEDIVVAYGHIPLITPRPPPPTSPYGTRLANLAERNKPENKPIVNTPAWRPIEDDPEPKRVSARVRGVAAPSAKPQAARTPSPKASENKSTKGSVAAERSTEKAPKKPVAATRSPKKPATPEKPTPKKEAPKKETPKRETSKKETPKKEAPKRETTKKDTPKKETLKKATPKRSATKPAASSSSKKLVKPSAKTPVKTATSTKRRR